MGDIRSIHVLLPEDSQFLDSILAAALPQNWQFQIDEVVYRVADSIPSIRAKLFEPGIGYTAIEQYTMMIVLEYFLKYSGRKPAFTEARSIARRLITVLKKSLSAYFQLD